MICLGEKKGTILYIQFIYRDSYPKNQNLNIPAIPTRDIKSV